MGVSENGRAPHKKKKKNGKIAINIYKPQSIKPLDTIFFRQTCSLRKVFINTFSSEKNAA